MKDEKPEKNRCNAFICSDVPIDKLHHWIRAFDKNCGLYNGVYDIYVRMLQWTHTCGYVAGTTGLLQFTTGNTGYYFRQVKTWWDFPLINCFYPASICILHWWVLYLWQAKIAFLVISPVFENRPFFRVPKNQWFIYLFFSCIAKCHLGKVKIKPMLVAGLSHWGQWITPETLVTWCKVFAGVALCLIVSESLQIQADNHRSNSRCFEQIFADCSWSLWINLHPF